MSDAPTSESVQARSVYLYENERYSPISGWSLKGLLPTDRSAFTSDDGRDGFRMLEEATNAFICPGWNWLPKQEWAVDINLDNIDKDGWAYGVDFSSFKDENCGSKVKGAMHFVRRRRWVRFQYFDTKLIAPAAELTCSYCDLQEVEKLSSLLLDKLCLSSALKHPSSNSRVKTIALKRSMMGLLDLSNPDAESYSYEMIETRMKALVSQSRSALSTASSMMASDTVEETHRKRTAWIMQNYFTTDEANEIARLILRVRDRSNLYHCEVKNCGPECEFFMKICANEGCGCTFSRKWEKQHDDVCLHKIVSCERLCGENVKRMNMRSHMDEYCGLRGVHCPCFELGCKAEICARDLKDHVQLFQVEHLAMTMKRLKEVQGVVAGHQKNIADLEKTCKQQETALAGVTAGLATAMAVSKAVEARSDQKVKEGMKYLESSITKQGTAVSANRADINTLKAQLAQAGKK